MEIRMLYLFRICICILGVKCCEQEDFLACPRINMTCATLVCSCSASMGLAITCNNNLTEVPINIPLDVWRISITGNNIRTVRSGAFANLHSVNALSLSKNNIYDIEPGAFTNLSVVYWDFDLSDNNLSVLREGVFKDFRTSRLRLGGNNISVIERRAFNNVTSLDSITDIGPNLYEVQSEAFWNMPDLHYISLTDNMMTVVRTRTFTSLPNIQTIVLRNNMIEVLETNAFCHLPSLSQLILSNNMIEVLETNAFCHLPSLNSLILNSNRILTVARDAFLNIVVGGDLVIGNDKEFAMQENIHSNYTRLIFQNPVSCNCSLMWLLIWKQERKSMSIYGTCAISNVTIESLQVADFTNCTDAVTDVTCETHTLVNINCVYSYITSTVTQLIHTRNGQLIRRLSNPLDPRVLTITFCSYEDAGEYTCMRSTNYLALPTFNETIKLTVNGPPFVLEQYSIEDGNNLVLSVVFYAEPRANVVDWLSGQNVISSGSHYTITKGDHLVSIKQHSVMINTTGSITNLTIHNFEQQGILYSYKINNNYGMVTDTIIARPVDIQLERNFYCDTSSKVEMRCTLGINGAKPVEWIHTIGGTIIRNLKGTHQDKSNTLNIPFCNYQDMGSYTCVWEVEGSLQFNKTTTLVIRGPPVIFEKSVIKKGNDTVLSVFFYSYPFPGEPQWFYESNLITLGPNYLQTTTFTEVRMRQHDVYVSNEGFKSSLTVSGRIMTYGVYSCKVANSFGTITAKITIINGLVDESPDDVMHKGTEESNVLIIVSSTGSVVFIIALVVIIICVVRCKRKNEDQYSDATFDNRPSQEYDSMRMSKIDDTQDGYIKVF